MEDDSGINSATTKDVEVEFHKITFKRYPPYGIDRKRRNDESAEWRSNHRPAYRVLEYDNGRYGLGGEDPIFFKRFDHAAHISVLITDFQHSFYTEQDAHKRTARLFLYYLLPAAFIAGAAIGGVIVRGIMS